MNGDDLFNLYYQALGITNQGEADKLMERIILRTSEVLRRTPLEIGHLAKSNLMSYVEGHCFNRTTVQRVARLFHYGGPKGEFEQPMFEPVPGFPAYEATGGTVEKTMNINALPNHTHFTQPQPVKPKLPPPPPKKKKVRSFDLE